MKHSFILGICLFLCISSLWAQDEPYEPLADPSLQELEEIQQEIEALEKELKSIQRLLDSVQKEKDAYESTITQLENQKNNLEERLNRLYEEKATKENELEWADELIINTEADINYNQSLLEDVVQNLSNLYIFSAYGETEAQDQANMQNLYLCTGALLHNIDSLFQTWSMAVQNHQLVAQNIEQITSQLRSTRYTYANITEQYKSVEDEIEFLARVEKDYQREAEELARGRTSLENFLAQREASKRGRDYTFEFVTPLIWPVDGEILSEFDESSAANNSLMQEQGVFIKAPEGTPVRCVAPGVVAYAGWFENKGNLVIIDHQNGFYSLYGYNDKLLVHKGMQVSQGQVIAYSGKNPIIAKPALWFELRKSGRPVNPLNYLPSPGS
jgi:septal ring factor EnvC (AmiA/AmiB activator)